MANAASTAAVRSVQASVHSLLKRRLAACLPKMVSADQRLRLIPESLARSKGGRRSNVNILAPVVSGKL